MQNPYFSDSIPDHELVTPSRTAWSVKKKLYVLGAVTVGPVVSLLTTGCFFDVARMTSAGIAVLLCLAIPIGLASSTFLLRICYELNLYILFAALYTILITWAVTYFFWLVILFLLMAFPFEDAGLFKSS